MNIAFGVQVIEGFASLVDDRWELVGDRFRAFAKGHFEVQFAKEFHDDEGGLGIGPEFDQLDDVLVIEFLGHFEFMLEEPDFLFVAPLFGPKDLQCVAFVVLFKNRFPNLAGASKSNESGQTIGPQEVAYFDHNPLV